MDFNEYQKKAATPSAYPKLEGPFMFPLVGMGGELGEIFEKVKKLFRDQGGNITQEFKDDIKKEIGDVLWYLTMFAQEFDITLEEVAQANLDKCIDRKKRNVVRGDGDNR